MSHVMKKLENYVGLIVKSLVLTVILKKSLRKAFITTIKLEEDTSVKDNAVVSLMILQEVFLKGIINH